MSNYPLTLTVDVRNSTGILPKFEGVERLETRIRVFLIDHHSGSAVKFTPPEIQLIVGMFAERGTDSISAHVAAVPQSVSLEELNNFVADLLQVVFPKTYEISVANVLSTFKQELRHPVPVAPSEGAIHHPV